MLRLSGCSSELIIMACSSRSSEAVGTRGQRVRDVLDRQSVEPKKNVVTLIFYSFQMSIMLPIAGDSPLPAWKASRACCRLAD
jgi:hypothetical protein